MARIWVRLRDHPTKQILIEESEFNADKHMKQTEREKEIEKIRASINIKEICMSGRAPGMFMKSDDSRGSVIHNHKLDAGAAGDLLDKGLDGARKRASTRSKKYGNSFRKMKTGKLVPKRKKK